MNIVYVCMWTYPAFSFLLQTPSSGIAESYGKVIDVLKKFPKWFSLPPAMSEDSSFSAYSLTFVIIDLFSLSHPLSKLSEENITYMKRSCCKTSSANCS